MLRKEAWLNSLKTAGITICLALLCLVIGFAFKQLFTDAPTHSRYHSLRLLQDSDVRTLLGQPFSKGTCSDRKWVDGFAKPQNKSCAAYWVYRERYGIYYLFFNDAGRVILVEYCGG